MESVDFFVCLFVCLKVNLCSYENYLIKDKSFDVFHVTVD